MAADGAAKELSSNTTSESEGKEDSQKEKRIVMESQPLKPTGLPGCGLWKSVRSKGQSAFKACCLEPHFPFLIQISEQWLRFLLQLIRLAYLIRRMLAHEGC